MTDLTNKSELISCLKSHGLWAKHSLGQNFLVDREALEKIVEAAGLKFDDTVLEVGPGLGVLTRELVQKAKKVIAIELDKKLAEDLSTNARDDKLKVVNADILKTNMPELIGGQKYKVVANIPYYITSKILEFFLTQKNKPESIVMLVQKEVAERICAKPGDMSILALSVQAYGQPEIIDIVPKKSFFPAPEVDSAILKIRIENKEFRIKQEQEKDLFRLFHIGFASKRKTLANNLMAGFHLDKKKALDIIESVGLGENVRAQELSLSQWQELTKGIKK